MLQMTWRPAWPSTPLTMEIRSVLGTARTESRADTTDAPLIRINLARQQRARHRRLRVATPRAILVVDRPRGTANVRYREGRRATATACLSRQRLSRAWREARSGKGPARCRSHFTISLPRLPSARHGGQGRAILRSHRRGDGPPMLLLHGCPPDAKPEGVGAVAARLGSWLGSLTRCAQRLFRPAVALPRQQTRDGLGRRPGRTVAGRSGDAEALYCRFRELDSPASRSAHR